MYSGAAGAAAVSASAVLAASTCSWLTGSVLVSASVDSTAGSVTVVTGDSSVVVTTSSVDGADSVDLLLGWRRAMTCSPGGVGSVLAYRVAGSATSLAGLGGLRNSLYPGHAR